MNTTFSVNLSWFLTGGGEMSLSKELEDEDDFPYNPEQ